MAKKSPKREPQPTPATEPAPAPANPNKVPPPSVKKPPMPADALKRMIKFYQDNREQERLIWRSIHG
jgi:hypothetical protein